MPCKSLHTPWNKIDLDEEYIIEQYVNYKKTIQDLADELGVNRYIIVRRLFANKVKLHSRAVIFLDVGQKFGRLTIIGQVPDEKGKPRKYLCICKCKNAIKCPPHSLISEATKSCGCLRKEVTAKRMSKYYEEISGAYWSQVKRHARDRELEFNITIEYVWNIFIKQNRKCILSGRELFFAKNKQEIRSRMTTASLDRFDSTKGYIDGNVQWIHKDFQDMKWDRQDEEFKAMCLEVVKHNNLI